MLLACFYGCRTLVLIPVNSATLILTIERLLVAKSTALWITYARLIMQVRANNALWTEFVDM
jgi:hypothetical protein